MESPACPVSVIVITRNEERNIAACLQSVAWARERVVVDSGSTDATLAIAREFNGKVFSLPWQGYGAMKNAALAHCTQPWVLWLDADERVPPALAAEIQSLLAGAPDAAAYQVARRAYFLGQWIRHCGWYPGYVTRLFRRAGARFNTKPVHEELLVPGAVRRLHNDLLHFTDDTLEHYFHKFNTYTSLAADEIVRAGGSARWRDLLVRPPFTFFRMYFLRAGFLDGVRGAILCALSAFYVFVKYAKTWETQRQRQPQPIREEINQ
jgi:glycosyltransferase involved in cell wall biosynthesis